MAFAAARNEIHYTFNGLFAVQTASANFDDTHTVAPMLQALLLQTYPFSGLGPSVGWAFDTPNPMRSQGAARLVPRLPEKAVQKRTWRRWNKGGIAKMTGISTSQEARGGWRDFQREQAA